MMFREKFYCENDLIYKYTVCAKRRDFPFLYIFLLLRFVIKNKDLFTTNNKFHNLCTQQHHNFHQPSVNLKKYQTGVYYMAIKIFNSLPSYIKKEFTNPTKFVTLVKNLLCEDFFLLTGRLL